MEEYVFQHQGLFFRIFTDYDLTFDEVKGILDHLIEERAFDETGSEFEELKLYSVPLRGHVYDVDVMKYEIAIYKKTKVP